MSAAPIPKVPARVARIPHVATLAQLPANLVLHPQAMQAPVLQRLHAGRNVKAVVCLRRRRLDRAARARELQALRDEIEANRRTLATFLAVVERLRFEIACMSQELQRREAA